MMHHKTLDAAYSSEDGTKFVATITTDTIDRDGEVVIPAGMNSKQYERNPVLLYAHDPKMPIGKMETLRRGDGKIEADFRLAPRPEQHEGEWLPDTVGALMKFGALRGVSIGFHAQANGMRSASKADVERYGDGVKRVFSKWNLLEVSVVSVPANQEALVTAIQKGVATAAAVKALGIEPSIDQTAQPERTMHRVIVSVPAVGIDDVRHAARVAMAKARGRFRF